MKVYRIDVATSKSACFTHYMGAETGYISHLYELQMPDAYTKGAEGTILVGEHYER